MTGTHDWRVSVDEDHLRQVAQRWADHAASGVVHLLHEVLAYVADEVAAVEDADPRCTVRSWRDGSFSVRDHGRGTDTRYDAQGKPVRKPVMATRDLRFFDARDPARLPDGLPRRGMSVVAALSTWLVHENHRRDGSWRQLYELGVPVEELAPVPQDGRTGTLVHVRPAPYLPRASAAELERLHEEWPTLRLAVHGQP